MRKVNGIYVTECISYPRSGHHWLHSRLDRYFNGRLNYCEMYTQPEKIINVCPLTNFQKSHDFGLTEIIRDDIKYIIQFRNFEEAFISYYRLERLNYATQVEEKDPLANKPHVDTNSPDYPGFRAEAKAYYDGFIDKWVTSKLPNSLVLKYEELLRNPTHEFASVISFLTDEKVDLERLATAIS